MGADMRVFALRVVLMLTLAILATSAISAGLSMGVSGSDATYMTIVTTACTALVAVALWLTRGARDAEETATAPAD